MLTTKTKLCCAVAFVCTASTTLAAQPLTQQICASATAYLARQHTEIQDSMLLIAGDLSGTAWSPAPPLFFGQSQMPMQPTYDKAYLAYFVKRSIPSAGAISAKISLRSLAGDKTNGVNVYRPAIARGENRCERRGRAVVDRTIRVNEYIDYHSPVVGGVSSTLEDFHFSYPGENDRCAQTNDQANISTFQFDNVERTQGDTFIARTFPIVGTAYAIGHNFALLRSELHYRAQVGEAGTCVGFFVPLSNAQQVSLVIHEHGFGFPPIRKAWLISR